jgi:Family of unknown function (DUF6174)
VRSREIQRDPMVAAIMRIFFLEPNLRRQQMLRIVRLAPVVLLSLVFGCSDSTAPISLNLNRLRWERQNFDDYSYVASHTCFCPGPEGFVRVEVTQGQVSRVVVLATGAESPTAGWYTVDELFDQLVRSPTATVVFDPRLGYPRRIETCCLENDSGSIYTADALTAAN